MANGGDDEAKNARKKLLESVVVRNDGMAEGYMQKMYRMLSESKKKKDGLKDVSDDGKKKKPPVLRAGI